MKKIILASLLIAMSVAGYARSLNVATPSATYSFTAAGMGDAIVENASEIVICGRAFPVSDILGMQVVENDLADNCVEIAYAEGAATALIAGNIAQYVDVAIEGAHVTITQSSLVGDDTCGEITYSLSGTSSDGSFSLDGSYKASIDLCGVSLTNPSGAAIDIQNGKRIELSVKSGTENYLCDGPDGDHKAALYCKGHLELKGKGVLTISGKKGHAISAKEYIEMKNCTIVIDEAVKDGINCTQYFLMESGELQISGIGDDAIQTDYKDDADREAEDTGSIIILDGKITATVTNRASKALKAEGILTVEGGTLDLAVTGGGVWDATKSKTKASSCLNSDENIVICGGTITLKATGSGGKGISCDGDFYMTDGTLDISTTGGVFAYVNNQEYDNYTGNTDNLDSSLKSSAKGIKADTYLQIDGGNINIFTTGVNAEGIESKGELVINGGTINVNAHDDAINSSSHMHINGGEICVVATDNDGLDSNGNLYLNGGVVRAFGTGDPECGIDANEEAGYTVIFTGGTLLGVGGSNSTPRSNASTQAFVTCNAAVAAGDKVVLRDGDTVLAEFEVPAEYAAGSEPGEGGFPGGNPGGGFGGESGLLITCPQLVAGTSYTVEVGTSTYTTTASLR